MLRRLWLPFVRHRTLAMLDQNRNEYAALLLQRHQINHELQRLAAERNDLLKQARELVPGHLSDPVGSTLVSKSAAPLTRRTQL